MAIQKNFVVKNGIEVNDNLIFADKDQNTVGIGTTTTPEKLQVNGGIGATSLVLSGVGTIPTLKSTTANINTGNINVGVVTSITGTGLTYTTGNFGTLNATTGNIVTGFVTTISGTTATYTNGYFTTLNSGTILVDDLFAVNGITTNGTVTNLTGTAATIGTVQIAAGIVTSSSGIVTYYGDGSYLNLSGNVSTGIGIGTTGGLVGYGITFLDLKGAGVSTTFYDNSVGIATIFFEGGGGGGGGAIGIGSTFPGTPLSIELPPSNGDLFFHIDYGRTFIYYDELVLGVGSSAFWIDAAPFNVGLLNAISGIAFSMGTASSPSAYFLGYPSTGFFAPTGGEFGIVSYGATILNVNPSGIVVTGIASATGFAGTYSGNLAVFSGNSTDNIVRITQTGTGNALLVEDSANPDATPFVITGIGSVGVGTNAPINTLDVHGTIRAARQDAVSDGGEIVFARASDNANAWALDAYSDSFRISDSIAGATRIHIGSGGNVGLGSTATSKLHVFGNASITGVTTIADVVKVGVGTTALIVEGNARVTGILTVGTGSITFDGSNNTITVGSGVTISASTGLTGSGENLTSLNASNLSSGTVPDARFPATLPSASGANLTSLNAGNISTGTLAIARGGTNSTSTPTQGGAAYGTGSAFAFTSAGSSGQVLTSNGTSAPTWQDAAGGGWNFIGSITANDSTSVSFTSGIDSTYDTYVVVGTGITAPYIEGNFLGSRYSTNSGSSYISTDDYNLAADFFQEILGQGVTEPVPFNLISVGIGDTTIYTNTNTCFTNWYFNLNSSTKAKICNSESITVAGIGGTYILREEYSSGLTTSSAVNAIEFLMDTGNISSGTFNLYGISNS